MAKRILIKEKLDRQLVGQSSSTPFMNIQEGYNNNKKTVLFDTRERIDIKIDKSSYRGKCQYRQNYRERSQ